MSESLGSTAKDIIDNFKAIDRENVGRRITEAAIIGGNLQFRWQGNGRLGVCVGDIGIRDATDSEYDQLEEAVELGQVQIYQMPLYVSGRRPSREVIHRATGFPLDENSPAAKRQRVIFARLAAARRIDAKAA